MTAALFAMGGRWHLVDRSDARVRDLIDGTGPFAGIGPHYSRQTPGARDFLGNGRTFVLLTDDGLAVWGVIENRDPVGGLHWRCAIFRNVGAGLSSSLILEATSRTFAYWLSHYGALPPVPLTTEIDARAVRRKRDPGRCFRRAGWLPVTRPRGRSHRHRNLVVLEAPAQ